MKKILLILYSLMIVVFSSPTQAQRSPGAILLHFNGYISQEKFFNYNVWSPSNLSQASQDSIISRVEKLFDRWDITVTTDYRLYNTFKPTRRVEVVVSTNHIGDVGGWSNLMSMYYEDHTPAVVNPVNLENNARNIGDAIAHEVGHMAGLMHQVVLDSTRNFILQDYNMGDSLSAPIMGCSYFAKEAIWTAGWNTIGMWQDDKMILDMAFTLKDQSLSYFDED